MEVLLVAAVVAFSLLPLWRARRQGGVPGSLAALAAAAGLAVLVAALCWTPTDTTPPAHRPLEVDGRGFVGSKACRSCHPDHHATWRESYHSTMTQVASRETLQAEFERLDLDWFGKRVRLDWRQGVLWVEFERGGRQPAPVSRPVEQITGSHHLQVLWYSTGNQRELAPVPMAYRIDEQSWLPLSAVFVLPPEFRDPPEPGTWNLNCHMCHATAVQPRVDTDRIDTHAVELGIACEACHGPGAAHVAANRDPLRRYRAHLGDGAEDTIVDPADLSPERSAQVCGQCHSVSILKLQHFERWREEGLPYRAGDDLTATRRILDPSDRQSPEARRQLRQDPKFYDHGFWPDGEVRLSGREYNGLLRSPCYVDGHGGRRMTCLSCHRMHRPPEMGRDEWRDDQLGPGMRGNAACTQCHAEFVGDEALAAHTHHAPTSPGSNCYDCHMSHTTFGLMKAMRSHTITSPSVAVELATGRPNACNQCHLDRPLGWTVEHLAARWGIEPVPLDDDQRDVAAAVRWLLSGDAGQRALAAWSTAQPVPRSTSGTDWLEPHLAQLLMDPYLVVRFLAERSLRTLPGDRSTALAGYDFLGGTEAARRATAAVQERWQRAWTGPARPAVLVDERGLMLDPFRRLFARRDDRPVYLAE